MCDTSPWLDGYEQYLMSDNENIFPAVKPEEILIKYQNEIRSIIEHAADFAKGQLAVESLKRFYDELIQAR